MRSSRDVLDRPAPPPDATVRYGPLPEHVADVRWPTEPVGEPVGEPVALVVVVHGGFWRAEYDRAHTGPQCDALARAGYAVASIEYRRTGMDGGGWPGTFDDVASALSLVPGLVADAARARDLEIDPSSTVLAGHSAGGHLVAWAATLPATVAAAAVSLAGVLDLALAAQLGLDPGPGGCAVEVLLGGAPDDVPDRYAAADPSRLGPPRIPVTALHGSDDEIVPLDLSRSYAEGTGQPAIVLPGADHFALIDPGSPAWADVLRHLSAAAGRTGR